MTSRDKVEIKLAAPEQLKKNTNEPHCFFSAIPQLTFAGFVVRKRRGRRTRRGAVVIGRAKRAGYWHARLEERKCVRDLTQKRFSCTIIHVLRTSRCRFLPMLGSTAMGSAKVTRSLCPAKKVPLSLFFRTFMGQFIAQS